MRFYVSLPMSRGCGGRFDVLFPIIDEQKTLRFSVVVHFSGDYGRFCVGFYSEILCPCVFRPTFSDKGGVQRYAYAAEFV